MRKVLLSGSATKQEMINAFGGYNHNLEIGENEFFDMQNMTGDNYPVISTRNYRGQSITPPGTPVKALKGYDNKIIGIFGDYLYLDAEDSTSIIDDEDFTFTGNNERQLIIMGAYLIIMPDKKYINLADTDERGSLDNTVEIIDVHPSTDALPGKYTTFSICDEDENAININVRSTEAPVNSVTYEALDSIDKDVEYVELAEEFGYIKEYFKNLNNICDNPTREMANKRTEFINEIEKVHQYWNQEKYREIIDLRYSILNLLNEFKTIITPNIKEVKAEEVEEAFDEIKEGYSSVCSIYDEVENPGGIIKKTEIKRVFDGCLWFNPETRILQKYYSSTDMWSEVETFVKISRSGIGKNFSAGDYISIKGIQRSYTLSRVGGNHDTIVILMNSLVRGRLLPPGTLTIEDEGLEKLNTENLTEIKLCGDNFIVVKGFVEYTSYLYLDPVVIPPEEGQEVPTIIYPTISRSTPDIDFMFECGNRLWGCHYGTDEEGKLLNEIYASKLGDFKNWKSYAGSSTDSYAASVGSEGKFTGAINWNGYPIFFKENSMHKVYGTLPENFQISTNKCEGVQSGSNKSMIIIDGILYYKSLHGVMAYDGSLPASISEKLGDEYFKTAEAMKYKSKYYISMVKTQSNTDVRERFVYDTKSGLWHKEEAEELAFTAETGKGTYFAALGGSKIYLNDNAFEKAESENNFSWYAETGKLLMQYPERKYCNRLIIRLKTEEGTILNPVYVTVEASYDDGEFEEVKTIQSETVNSVSFVIRPRRCDHMRIRLSGNGQTEIYSITKVIEEGSNISAQ